jgi:hypothetical protein
VGLPHRDPAEDRAPTAGALEVRLVADHVVEVVAGEREPDPEREAEDERDHRDGDEVAADRGGGDLGGREAGREPGERVRGFAELGAAGDHLRELGLQRLASDREDLDLRGRLGRQLRPGYLDLRPGLRIGLEGRFGGAAERLDLRIDLRDLAPKVRRPVLELLLGGQDRLDRLVAAVLDERGRERVRNGGRRGWIRVGGGDAQDRQLGVGGRADLGAERLRVVAPELLGCPLGDVERGRCGDLGLPDGPGGVEQLVEADVLGGPDAFQRQLGACLVLGGLEEEPHHTGDGREDRDEHHETLLAAEDRQVVL